MTASGDLSEIILNDALSDFQKQNLGIADLERGYVGLQLKAIMEQYVLIGLHTQVEFELAIKELEVAKLIDTGPYVPYENDPGSSVLLFGGSSKREYIFLTEKGYKAASIARRPKIAPIAAHSVHISRGVFHQSPLGIGTNIRQDVNYTDLSITDFQRLASELSLLCSAVLPHATAPEHIAAIGRLAEAQMAAQANDAPKVQQALSSVGQAGKWLLSTAEKIGVGLAAAALKTHLGL
ncbi:hypothetical protein ABNQ39_36405 (plasmid) [Azospirillum sp. A26]|uniref:hypothetical protein n=1 Tax=Azospirillum sp. A26 TaxID=3160607 RepID=UPI0036734135